MRWFEVQFQGLLETRQRFVFGSALAGYVDFQALRDVPVTFLPYASRKWTLHTFSLSPNLDRGQVSPLYFAANPASTRITPSSRWSPSTLSALSVWIVIDAVSGPPALMGAVSS